MMKKTTFGAALAFLAAATGALVAVAIAQYRREKELDEYEELLFGDDGDDTEAGAEEEETETVYEKLDAEEEEEPAPEAEPQDTEEKE